MRSIVLIITCALLNFNLFAQRYTTVRKFPLFPESSLHTFVLHFPTENEAYNKLPEQSPWYLPLSSGWKYIWSNDETNVAQYVSPRYIDSLWTPIKNGRLGMGSDTAKMQSKLFLRKVIPIPEDWYGLQVFVHFDYLMSPITIWVNGVRVGSTSTAPWGFEWNVTPYLVFGRLNTLLIQADATQLSDLVFGNAWLYAFPNVAIWDFFVTLKKSSKQKWLVETAVLPKTFLAGIEDKFNLEFQLYNRRGFQVINARRKGIKPAEEKWITFQNELPTYIPWQADTPYWYTAIFLLKNKNNETVDAIKYRVGMRVIESNDSVLLLNSQSWSIDSMEKTNIYSIQPTFLVNRTYRWIIFDLTPKTIIGGDLLKSIEKQVLSFRNYTPIAAWQISQPCTSEQRQRITELIEKLDPSRPVLWGSN
ncbi:MAG TPA: hypothetical protein PLD12_10975 [Bacteroidales bacterium]|nr:hypothetical protein [Bacteroidales bacterium]HOK99653.1 hypothetical protein [Bacteroidales bacterium]HPO66526.1 hypothetical protein [Bacteroidales bacterium]